jgi:thiaminase/transcriptional activator TenA
MTEARPSVPDVDLETLFPADGLFARLRARAGDEWRRHVGHEFVRRLADGSLPEAAFRHYLGQDYLFLIHFARAYGLAAYKSDDLEDIRQASAGLSVIVDVEMGLHVDYCKGWGLGEADLAALPEDPACLAYTRFVLERGAAGDLLDLHTALAPCVVGYAEIGLALAVDPATRRDGNPYRSWIEMYAGEDYQAVARAEAAQLDRLFATRGGPGREESLAQTFVVATRLEAGFWQMGLDASG